MVAAGEARVVAAGEARGGCVAYWTDGPLAELKLETAPLFSRHSTLDSGFARFEPGAPPLDERLAELVRRWPGNAKLVDGVPFAFGKGSQLRQVLVIAMAGLAESDEERIREDFLRAVGADTISFPLREAADHLRTRIGSLAFAVSPEGVRVDEYQVPSGRRRIEAMLVLTPDEMSKLRAYAGGVIDDTLGVLGPITMLGGARTTRRTLNDNRPTDGTRHNCTTWVTLAPIGADGADLSALAQMPASWTSHDNPGWWSLFLTGASRSERARHVIYWTDRPLADEPLAPGKPLPWNFNPK